MALGDQNLTGVTAEAAMTVPGMAFFAGTGPVDKYCKDCKFRGFSYQGRARINPKNGNEYFPTHSSNGCEKNFEMRGRKKPGPDIPGKTRSCKFFEQRPPE